MKRASGSPNEYPHMPGRGRLISEIIGRSTLIPYSNLSLGNRATDEPTQFSIFAMYFPLQPRNYELLSENFESGSVAPAVRVIRDKLKAVKLNPESLRLHQEGLKHAIERFPVLAEMGEGRMEVDTFGLPQLMIAFGHRVRDEQEVALMFFPSHVMDPSIALDEFRNLIEEVDESEKI